MPAEPSPPTADRYSADAFGVATLAAFAAPVPADRAAAIALRERLERIGFTAAAAARLFGLDELIDVRARRAAYYEALVLPDGPAAAAARFFVLHRAMREAELRDWLGDASFAFLRAHGAVVPADGGWRSLVSATWFADRLVFADARAYNVLWPGEPFADYVMPPGHDSLGLVRVASRVPRRTLLDLCCGPGTQALAAAAYAERVVGVDLNPRAVRFARLNAAANGLDARVTFLEGDAYAPLGDARFDAIVANPPFVPWPDGDGALLYRGGGPRGDRVVARILAEAAAHLTPDGTLALVGDLADAATLPERIAQWQGERRRTLIVLQHHDDALDYAERHAAHYDDPGLRGERVVRMLRHFAAAGIATIDFGYIVQDGAPGNAEVFRTTAARDGAIAGDVAAWFAHQRRLDAGGAETLPLALAPGLRLIEVAARTAAADASFATSVVPGPGSLQEAEPVGRAAFALLLRVASETVRPCDVAAAELRDLAALLRRGLVRVAEAPGTERPPTPGAEGP